MSLSLNEARLKVRLEETEKALLESKQEVIRLRGLIEEIFLSSLPQGVRQELSRIVSGVRE